MPDRPAQWFDVLAQGAPSRRCREDAAIVDILEAVDSLLRCSGAGGRRVADALLEVVLDGRTFEDALGIRATRGARPLRAAFRRMMKRAAVRLAAESLGAASCTAAAEGVARLVREGRGEHAKALRDLHVPASPRQILRILSKA